MTSLFNNDVCKNGNYEEWSKNLQKFIYSFLDKIFKEDEKERKVKYVGSEAMKIWIRSFTHETWSINKSYEELEYFGDSVLKLVFPKYLMTKYPDLKKNQYTELNIKYMSTEYQGELGKLLGFDKYVRMRGINQVLLSINADLFESFFGALFTISDMVESPGYGYINTYNLITQIMEAAKPGIDLKFSKGNPITQVQQIFDRFSLDPIKEYVEQENKFKVKFSVVLTARNIEFLALHFNVIMDNPIIGIGEKGTKDSAKLTAYENALKLLQDKGVTTEMASIIKDELDFNHPDVVKYRPAALERAKEENIIRLYFYTPQKLSTPHGQVIQLIGIKSNNDLVVLETVYVNNTANNKNSSEINKIRARAELVKRYGSKIINKC